MPFFELHITVETVYLVTIEAVDSGDAWVAADYLTPEDCRLKGRQPEPVEESIGDFDFTHKRQVKADFTAVELMTRDEPD